MLRRGLNLRTAIIRLVVLVASLTSVSFAAKKEHTWLTGKILDTNQVSHYAGTVGNASGNATSYGNTTSGTAYGSQTAIYRVYDTLVVEGEDYIYVTSEQLHWRWSKGAHVVVNDEIKYYVDGRKLHVLDQDEKEHTVQITKTIKREQKAVAQSVVPPVAPTVVTTGIAVSVSSTPPGADIEVDGAFVGSTPSTITVPPGQHTVNVNKKGFAEWSRSINLVSGTINISADLEPKEEKP